MVWFKGLRAASIMPGFGTVISTQAIGLDCTFNNNAVLDRQTIDSFKPPTQHADKFRLFILRSRRRPKPSTHSRPLDPPTGTHYGSLLMKTDAPSMPSGGTFWSEYPFPSCREEHFPFHRARLDPIPRCGTLNHSTKSFRPAWHRFQQTKEPDHH